MNFSELLDTIIVAAIIGAMWLLSNWSERRPRRPGGGGYQSVGYDGGGGGHDGGGDGGDCGGGDGGGDCGGGGGE
ncbi:MAG: hypothetical protein H0T76_24270 [Nannocystis sp.]|nr:hypothetical protein [Nannocystis sp.]MBA3549605.1 hypothetical protein [Nannocystis sp.]